MLFLQSRNQTLKDTSLLTLKMLWPLYMTIRALNGVTAMLANLLTLVCVCKFRYLRTPANILVANIAFNDLVHGLVPFLIIMRFFSSTESATHVLCQAGIFIELITTSSEVGCFALLAMERWNGLRAQLNRRKKWSIQRTVILVGCLWMILIGWLTMLNVRYVNVTGPKNCTMYDYYPVFSLYVGGIFFILISLIIFIFYGSIAWIAYSSHNQTAEVPSAVQIQQGWKKEMRITRMMAMVCGVFFTLYSPAVLTVMFMSSQSPQWLQNLYYVTVIICDVNFWINPLIYAWRDKNFNKAFCSILAPVQSLFTRCCPNRMGTVHPVDTPPGGNNAPEGDNPGQPRHMELRHSILVPRRDVEIPTAFEIPMHVANSSC